VAATDVQGTPNIRPSIDHPNVVVRAFPSTDATFGRDVVAAIDGVLTQSPGDDAVTIVEGLLHRRYPNVRVHHQTDLARLVEWQDVWYAYRDGRVRPPNTQRERLYSILSTARQTRADSAAILERSQSVARDARFEPRSR
jgi:hypothetical protein